MNCITEGSTVQVYAKEGMDGTIGGDSAVDRYPLHG
jgi:hypothetical protein